MDLHWVLFSGCSHVEALLSQYEHDAEGHVGPRTAPCPLWSDVLRM